TTKGELTLPPLEGAETVMANALVDKAAKVKAKSNVLISPTSSDMAMSACARLVTAAGITGTNSEGIHCHCFSEESNCDIALCFDCTSVRVDEVTVPCV